MAGQRLVASVPHGHYKTCTLIAAIGRHGALAPWIVEGAMNGELFLAWIQQGLAPHLRAGDLVIMPAIVRWLEKIFATNSGI